MSQMVENLPAMRETWVQSLGWEDPLEEGMATHSSTPAWRIPMDRGPSPGREAALAWASLAQRLVWAAKQPLGNAALGALFA